MNNPLSLPSHLAKKLTAWFQTSARVLPWRSSKPRDPYRVWVSEIMLQQTRVSAVIGYFERFMLRFPNIHSLAATPEQDVLKAWEGLGYYSRAKNLHKTAKLITEIYDGKFPSDYPAIRSLPGIGDYTAGTIASICFNLPYPSIDGNVLRVISRITASSKDIAKPQTKMAVYEALLPLYKNFHARGELTESLMELGALVCVPNGQPKCNECPLAGLCKAYQAGLTEQIPVKSKKPARIVENYTVFILESNGYFAVRQRPADGLLASLWEFVNCGGFLDERDAAEFLDAHKIQNAEFVMMKNAKHIFTHKEWDMRVYFLKCSVQSNYGNIVWKHLDDITLPSAFKKLLANL